MIEEFARSNFFFVKTLRCLSLSSPVRSCARMSWQNMQVPLQICVSADSDAPSKISVVPLSRGLKIENLASDSDGSTMFSKDALLHAGRRLLKNNNVRAQDA